jgi:hypothetical protein
MANTQCGFYCKPSVPVATGYSVSEAFRTQVSSPSRAKPVHYELIGYDPFACKHVERIALSA